MKKIFVHVHLFYKDMWSELKSCLSNIEGYEYDLFVSLVDNDSSLQDDILLFKQDANIIICENKGYDIMPFVKIINSINLDDYSCVVKLHTKRNTNRVDLNSFSFKGSDWRNCLLNFIKTKDNFAKCINILEQSSDVGMCADSKVIVKYDIYDKIAKKRLQEFVSSKSLKNTKYSFVAGTMFIARASVFNELKLIDLSSFESDFKSEGQYAHMVERLLGYIVYLSNLKIVDAITSKPLLYLYKINIALSQLVKDLRPLSYIFSSKTTKSNKLLIKILKIPVLSIKLKSK